jgi:hypothetical protein
MIRFQHVGYLLGDRAARIEPAWYVCWRASDHTAD